MGKCNHVEPWASADAIDMSGTGNVQSGALTVGNLYMLTAGTLQDVRYRFGSSAATAVGTDAILPAKESITFYAGTASAHVAVIGENGAAAHDATLVPVKKKLPSA